MSKISLSPRKSWGLYTFIISAIIFATIFTPSDATPASTLDIPQPKYPENYTDTTPDSDPPLGVPSFSWSVVNGATKYRLQVDSEIGFNNPIVMSITTENTSFTPASTSNLFADGDWYWRVRVEEPAPVGGWSEIMLFTKSWATDENQPMLLSPSADAVMAFFTTPAFSWTPVIGAAKYRFQIAGSQNGFSSPIFSEETLSTTIQPNNNITNAVYWWRVIPMDAADHLGTSSEIRRFSLAYGTYAMNLVPTLLSPADESFPTFTPAFHWRAVEGAEHYRLEYTTDDTCDFNVGTSVDTVQTSYAPTDTFPNNARYCWRVRVESGSSMGDWSEIWHFQKRWYLQPQLLTPTHHYQTGLYPLYSWTPVPGASSYKIEIADNPSFNPMFEAYTTTNTTYAPQAKYFGTNHYYWRVTPIDGGGELGLSSAVAEFQGYYNSTAPILVYPLYYYLPNDPNYYGEFTLNPVEDRTVAYPIFIWHRVMTPAPDGGVYAAAYRIQVDTTPGFNHVIWQYDTENTSATPTNDKDFPPQVGQDYYWRVCVLDYLGGNCRVDPYSGWSQIWKARFDPQYDPDHPNPWVLPPTNGDAPELLTPVHGQESVEATPLLQWRPLHDTIQIQYQVEISRDANFVTHEISEIVNIPAYSPSDSIAQRSFGRTGYGTFYWRVRAYVDGTWGDWSDVWRFQIASQSEWRYSRSLGNPANRLLIGTDPPGDTSLTNDLTNLYASQSDGYWFFGFDANITSTDMTYAFYIDLDHLDSSGANTTPERHYLIYTIAAHQPEYVIYVDKIGGVINSQNTWVYAWNGNAWGIGKRLFDIGGLVFAASGYVELQLPNTAIGMSHITSSASVMLISVNNSTNVVEDSVPSDPEVPGNTQLSRFSAVSDHLNLISPPNTVSGDPRTIPSLLPFHWDWPTGSAPSTPFAGIKLEVHTNPNYTNLVAEFQINSPESNFGENSLTLLDDISGDDIYYWRIQPRYWSPGHEESFGAWTGGWSFRRSGFTAQNLKTSVAWATPTFRWDMVEGAYYYRLQVSTDSSFNSMIIDQATPLTSYTPSAALAQGDYYWRVQVIRYGNIVNAWSSVEQYNLTLPAPSGLTPGHNTKIQNAPTFCWDPLMKYYGEPPFEPILTAWNYHIQVSRNENFGITYDSVDTYNNCWTPSSGYPDGIYWWRVAMIDGSGNMGSYSSIATYTKQYPVTTLVSPKIGVVIDTPTFIWTRVDGAATYRFEVSLYPNFSSLFDSVDTINTQFTPTKIYDKNEIYYWRVAIRDHSGKQGPFTDAYIRIRNYLFLPLIGR